MSSFFLSFFLSSVDCDLNLVVLLPWIYPLRNTIELKSMLNSLISYRFEDDEKELVLDCVDHDQQFHVHQEDDTGIDEFKDGRTDRYFSDQKPKESSTKRSSLIQKECNRLNNSLSKRVIEWTLRKVGIRPIYLFDSLPLRLRQFRLSNKDGFSRGISWSHKFIVAATASTVQLFTMGPSAEPEKQILSNSLIQGAMSVRIRPFRSPSFAVAHKSGVCVWNPAAAPGYSPEIVVVQQKGLMPVSDLCWSPDGAYLAMVSHNDNALLIWESKSHRIESLRLARFSGSTLVSWSPSGHFLITVHTDGSFLLWETSRWTYEIWRALPDHRNRRQNLSIQSITWHDNASFSVLYCDPLFLIFSSYTKSEAQPNGNRDSSSSSSNAIDFSNRKGAIDCDDPSFLIRSKNLKTGVLPSSLPSSVECVDQIFTFSIASKAVAMAQVLRQVNLLKVLPLVSKAAQGQIAINQMVSSPTGAYLGLTFEAPEPLLKSIFLLKVVVLAGQVDFEFLQQIECDHRPHHISFSCETESVMLAVTYFLDRTISLYSVCDFY